jgi:hypothetical protein
LKTPSAARPTPWARTFENASPSKSRIKKAAPHGAAFFIRSPNAPTTA